MTVQETAKNGRSISHQADACRQLTDLIGKARQVCFSRGEAGMRLNRIGAKID
jgi:hypothetical protein